MELQFETKMMPCLRRDLWQVQDREQTQELRLPEGLPDIGSIIATRGQCVVRSKEWLGESIGVSGGVTVWVLYAPADGSEPRSVEAWVPVQGKWNLPKTRREGVIRADMRLKSADARTTSARKMMIRAQVSMLAEVLEPGEVELAVPPEEQSDVQLLRRTYPAVLPREAGEKLLSLEEDLPFAPGVDVPARIVYATCESILREQKVVGSRVVFRGDLRLHMLCADAEGRLYSVDMESPFSQFTDLDNDYDKEATAETILAVTNFEPELVEGALRLKCGLLAQYVICQNRMVEIVEDAYNPRREVAPMLGQLELPAVLDSCADRLRAEAVLSGVDGRILDSWVCGAHPNVRQAGEQALLDMEGTAGALYRDAEGNLRGSVSPWSQSWELAAGENVAVQGRLLELSSGGAVAEGDGITLRVEMEVQAQMTAAEPMTMLTGLEIGEEKPVDRNRPSLILLRSADQSLWEMAKICGSTVEAICRANGITAEPLDDRILLIPVS